MEARSQRRMMEKRPHTEKTMSVPRLCTMAPMKSSRQKKEHTPSSDMVTGHRIASILPALRMYTNYFPDYV
jgi:hypothetical protein